jgi:hypothetical protein
MYRLMLAGLLLVAGCQNILGPFQPRDPKRVDNPNLSISEQESLGRNRYAFPQSSPNIAPPMLIDRPDPQGY